MFLSDQHGIRDAVASSGEAGIPARLTQSLWGPQDKNATADRKSGGIAATFMEMADEQLYGKAYAQTLRGDDKADMLTQVADAKVPTGFPAAKIVAGENGYIDFGAAKDELTEKRDAKRLAA